MSAFMVSDVHVHAMLTAGLDQPHRFGVLRWAVRDLTDEETREAYAEGEWMGHGALEVYGRVFRELTEENAGYVGAMLLAENRRSVNHRYAEDEIEQAYLYRELRGPVDPVVVLKAVDCFEYQSCEHPGWQSSEARRFCDALRSRMIGLLPGYADAEGWEVRDADVFLRAAQVKS